MVKHLLLDNFMLDTWLYLQCHWFPYLGYMCFYFFLCFYTISFNWSHCFQHFRKLSQTSNIHMNLSDTIKHELRVESLKERVESLKTRFKIQKCEFESTSDELNSTSYEFKSTSYEYKSTSSLNQWKLK